MGGNPLSVLFSPGKCYRSSYAQEDMPNVYEGGLGNTHTRRKRRTKREWQLGFRSCKAGPTTAEVATQPVLGKTLK